MGMIESLDCEGDSTVARSVSEVLKAAGLKSSLTHRATIQLASGVASAPPVLLRVDSEVNAV